MEQSETRVIMEHRVAGRWLRKIAEPEYRFQVLFSSQDQRGLLGLLESFRDGKIAMSGVPAFQNFGIKVSFDGIGLWSKDRVALLSLQKWFEDRGLETTGVW